MKVAYVYHDQWELDPRSSVNFFKTGRMHDTLKILAHLVTTFKLFDKVSGFFKYRNFTNKTGEFLSYILSPNFSRFFAILESSQHATHTKQMYK